MSKMNKQVDGYIRKNKKWEAELRELRRIILDSPLSEEVKWRVPVYTLEGKNVVFLGALKEHCVISFIKGVLLKDPKHILIQQTEESQSVRIIRFSNTQEIIKLEKVLKAYVDEAVEVERAGLKVKLKKISDRKIPEELQKKLDEAPALKAAFSALTPGRQRAYLLYFASAKQSKTREARVEKSIPDILKGKGIFDK